MLFRSVLVVPVSCVSQGGLEQTLCTPPMFEEAVVAVLVVPVSWVSQGGLEQTRVTVPVPSPDPASVELGCSEVGEARMDTGRSCTGWASTPLGVVMRVTWVGWGTDWETQEERNMKGYPTSKNTVLPRKDK